MGQDKPEFGHRIMRHLVERRMPDIASRLQKGAESLKRFGVPEELQRKSALPQLLHDLETSESMLKNLTGEPSSHLREEMKKEHCNNSVRRTHSLALACSPSLAPPCVPHTPCTPSSAPERPTGPARSHPLPFAICTLRPRQPMSPPDGAARPCTVRRTPTTRH